MSIAQRYKEIFSHEILERSKGAIFSFSPLADNGHTSHLVMVYLTVQ